MKELRNKVIYIHTAKEDLTVENISFVKGQIVYIGSGHFGRNTQKSRRSESHMSIWNKLNHQVIMQGLTSEEALQYEQRMIVKNIQKGLLNKLVSTGTFRDYIYKELNEIFYLDDEYNVCWKCNKNISGKTIVRIGALVGNNHPKYKSVTYQNRKYKIHRIVWCLFNKKDALGGTVIDHINRNSLDNHPLNLRLVTPSENNLNRDFLLGKTGERYISFIETRKTYVVKTTSNPKFSHLTKTFPIGNLVKIGYTEDEAKKIAFKNAIEYRDSLLI